jgi:type IV pilus assembly protein PilB
MLSIDELKSTPLSDLSDQLRLRLKSGTLKISDLCDIILQKSVLMGTSDIHILPTKDEVRVRCRVDGCFRDLVRIPIARHDQIVNRIKVLADLLSHQKSIVQEGRITITVEDKTQDLRVSIVPTIAGENVVMRMFSGERETFELDKIGYAKDMRRRIQQLLFDLRGMVVMAGPSGTGKTTTLYSMMLTIARELEDFASMITIEDPVEYEFGVFPQMQVDRNNDLDFASGLSAVLRQDPEVIMVGEIRDLETAEVALRASLTGHMVLTTVHAGSACETVARLINMGLEPFVIASALTGVLSQRLVRRLCTECLEDDDPGVSKLELVKLRMKLKKAPTLKRGKGCPACSQTGFRGRTPITELLEVDDSIRNLILKKTQTSAIRQHLETEGWSDILRSGLSKAIAGETTLDEILRVVSLREA